MWILKMSKSLVSSSLGERGFQEKKSKYYFNLLKISMVRICFDTLLRGLIFFLLFLQLKICFKDYVYILFYFLFIFVHVTETMTQDSCVLNALYNDSILITK